MMNTSFCAPVTPQLESEDHFNLSADVCGEQTGSQLAKNMWLCSTQVEV